MSAPPAPARLQSVTIETERPVDLAQVRAALESASGVRLVDEPSQKKYPMPLTATGSYDVEVGRLRKSLVFGDNGLDMFIVGDQLLRGAALNAVLIAEVLQA
jgi:aspartate-semialdehyde dehydrogenase